MILIEDLLQLDAILVPLQARSLRHALECLLDKIAENHPIEKDRALELLVEREKLGSTAIGNGVALPHTLIENIEGAVGCFARLAKPIEFDAPDDRGVDLLFLLLADKAGGAQHARTISHISRIMSQRDVQNEIRRAKNRNDIHEVFKNHESVARAQD